MDNIDIDLEILEEMCSDLEESAFLLDNNMDIVWINNPLKEHILLYLKSASNPKGDVGVIEDAELIRKVCIELFGELIFEESKRIFDTGRLNRRLMVHNDSSIKVLSLPIKYGRDVLYLLNVIEEKPANLGHDYYPDYVRLLLDQLPGPAAFIGMGSGIMVTNKHFDSLFRNSPRIKKFILENIQSRGFHKELRDIGYEVHFKDVNKDKVKIASICAFKKNAKRKEGKIIRISRKNRSKKKNVPAKGKSSRRSSRGKR